MKRSLLGRPVAVLGIVMLIGCDRTDDAAAVDPVPLPEQDAAAPTSVSFDTDTLTFITAAGSVPMVVEVAARADQRAFGLMDRDSLGTDAGMIFLYDQPQSGDTGFWMYRTRIPLDIAYFDGAGRIVAIQQMMPCTSFDPARCIGYAAGVPFFGAVEANRGWFTRNGIATGDRVSLPGRIGG